MKALQVDFFKNALLLIFLFLQNLSFSQITQTEYDQDFISGAFRIHYSIDQSKYPSCLSGEFLLDSDSNGRPDIIDTIAYHANLVRTKSIAFGYLVPEDNNKDGLLNIVISSKDNSTGQNDKQDPIFVGSEKTYIELTTQDTPEALINNWWNKSYGSVIQTIYHEFRHLIQKQYDPGNNLGIQTTRSTPKAFIESEAEWYPELINDDINKNFIWFRSPSPRIDPNMELFNWEGYYWFFWFDFLHQKYENNDPTNDFFNLAFWNRRKLYPNERVEVTYEELFKIPNLNLQIPSTLNTNFIYPKLSASIFDLYTWIYFSGPRAILNSEGKSTYGFDEAPSLPTPSGTEITGSFFSTNNNLKPYASARFYTLKSPTELPGIFTFSWNATNDNVTCILVTRTGTGITTEVIPKGNWNQSRIEKEAGLLLINASFNTESFFTLNVSGFTPEKIAVTLFNESLEGNLGGIIKNLTTDEFIQSGDSAVMQVNSVNTLQTLSETILNLNNHRLHNWQSSTVHFQNIFNYSPDVSSNQSVTAKYNVISPISLNQFSDGGSVGSIPFQDPWTSQNQTEFLPASGSKDVFLGEDRFDPGYPYYQIKTDRVKAGTGSLAGLNLSFQNWSSTGTEPLIQSQTDAQPVVFTAAGATVTANYKAMLVSKTAGWVTGNQFVSVNGTGSVFYKTDNKLWLHKEDGATQTEIMITHPAQLLTPRSISQSGTNRFIIYQTNAGDHWFEQVSSSVNFSTNLSLPVAGRTPVSVFRLHDPAVKPNPVLVFMYMEGTRVRFQCTELNGDVLPANPVFSSWFQTELSGMLTSSTQVQLVGNGNVVYLVWLYNGKLYSQRYRRGNTHFANSAPTLIYTSSSGNYLSFSAAVTPTHDLSLMLNRKETGVNNNKTTGTGKWYYNGSVQPYTVLETTTQFVSIKGLSSEGPKLLTAIGKSSDQETWSYFLWKFNGTDWIKETTSFSSLTPELLPGEVDFRPSETAHPSGLKLMTLNTVNWPPPGANKITTGTEDTPLLSISGVELSDTLVYNVNMDPAIVDSIIIDILGVWSIAVKGAGFVTETVNDLKLFGSSELVVTTSESGTSRTIKFIPNLVKWDVWVVDPSGNKVRMRKENSDEELGSESIQTEVAVYPNPFNPETRINVRLAEPGELKVKVYNVVGQLVADLANGHHDSGDYSFRFDGKSLASGTYFYRVEIGEKVKTGKLQLLK